MESSLWDAAQAGDLRALKYLLEEGGVDPNVADSDGWTALHFTMVGELGSVDVLETLLKWGADPNAKNKYGETPIFFANDAASAHILIEAGAKVLDVIDDGDTPLHSASSEGRLRMVRFLILEAGGKISVNAQNRRGNTPLHEAVQDQQYHIVEVLLQHGCADPTILNDNCQSAIDLARENITGLRINPVSKLGRKFILRRIIPI